MQQDKYREIYRQRGPVAEFSHACVKAKRGLRKFLRRGLAKVRTELAWPCLSCNVTIRIRWVWEVSLRAPTQDTCAQAPIKGPGGQKRETKKLKRRATRHCLVLRGRRGSAPGGAK
jgi:hypothetical protein